jgi:hypothetical protein
MPFPMPVILPAPPVPLKLPVGNPVIVPTVSVPVMASVVCSPTGVYIEIESGDVIIIGPTPVIILRAIPKTVMETPPEAIPEKQVYAYIGNNIDIVRIGNDYHIRRGLKCDRRRIIGCPGL